MVVSHDTLEISDRIIYLFGRSDVHMKNLAYRISDFESWPMTQIYKCLGSPIKQAISRYDNNPPGPEAPPYAVLPAYLFKLKRSFRDDIAILDFGEASFASESRKRWHTPIILQAPEALLGESVNQSADIWAFACTVFALFNNRALFDSGMLGSDDVLAEIVDTLGRLPERWWQKWKYRDEFYEEDGTKKTENLMEEYHDVRPLTLRIRQMRSSPSAARDAEQLSEEDLEGLQELLEHCFRYKPEDRVTAEDILKLDWIRNLSVGMLNVLESWNMPRIGQKESLSSRLVSWGTRYHDWLLLEDRISGRKNSGSNM